MSLISSVGTVSLASRVGDSQRSLWRADRQAGMDSVAKALGESTQALQQELQGGKSLSEVGKAHGLSDDQVKQAFLQGVQGAVKDDVGKGTLSQSQADQILSRLQSNLDKVIHHKGHHHAHHQEGGASSATNTPTSQAPVATTPGSIDVRV